MSMKSFLAGLFTQKAGSVGVVNADGQAVNNSFQIIGGNAYTQDLSPANLIKMATGWVAICNNKNSSTCASIPLKLYYYNQTGQEPVITRFKRLERKHQNTISKGLRIELKQEEEIEEITEHPVLDLLSTINSSMNYQDFMEIVFEYLGVLGNSYVQIIEQNGKPVELIPLLSEYVTPFATGKNQGKILYYMYKPDEKGVKLSPEQVIHFAQYAPGNTLIGRGDLENCINAQERYLYYDAFEKYLGVNNSRPDFAVVYKNKINEKDLKEMYRQWNKRFGGVRNSGNAMVATGELDIKNLGFAPRDLQYQVGREWARQEICAAFGIPKSLVTTDDVNLANSVAGLNQYLKLTIYPKMVKFCEKLNEQLLPKYDQNLYVWFEANDVVDPKEKTTSTIQAYQAGILDRNEARESLGYEATEEEGENDNGSSSQE